MVYPGVHRANKGREVDRNTWSDSTLHVFVVDLSAQSLGAEIASTQEIVIDFKTVFEAEPLFHWAVELYEGETLVEGDYPMVNAAIASWTLSEVVEPEQPVYLGATVWVSVRSEKNYLFRYRFGFEGVTFRNVQTFRGALDG